jgi:hypothetical protein
MLPRRNRLWGEGERERLVYRRHFVFNKARDNYNVDEIAELWNEHCIEENRPDDQRTRKTIAEDLRDGLRELATETKTDAEAYRVLLISRIEAVFSTQAFRTMLSNAHLGAIDRYLKGQDQIAKLSGANAPVLNALTDSQGNDILPSLSDKERQERINVLFRLAQQRALESGVVIEGELLPPATHEPSLLDAIGATNQNAEEAESSAS